MNTPFAASRRRRHRQSGLSLVEVMIGLAIFGLIALGTAAATIQAQRIATQNILRNTAYNVAEGYLEQIKSLPWADIQEIQQFYTDGQTIEDLKILNAIDPISGVVADIDGLDYNVWNDREVVIDVDFDEDTGQVTNVWLMDLQVRPRMERNSSLDAVECFIDFRFENRGRLIFRSSEESEILSLRFVRSAVKDRGQV